MKTIITERLILEELTLETLLEIEKMPKPQQMDFFDKDSIERVRENILRIRMYWASSLIFILRLKETNEAIGFIGFYRWFKEHRRSEIGYILKKKYHKQGLMREAVKAHIKYGFEELNINRMEAVIEPINLPSIGIAKYFNFQKEGFLRQHYIHKGRITDSLMYALLKEDWLSQ